MTPLQTQPDTRLRSIRRTPAQARLIDAALELFGEHGVSGTSLQMIADALGVTKAAVYHQYPAKDDIVLAAIEVELAKVEEALDEAAVPEPGAEARDRVLRQVIDLAVERRTMVSAVQHDPVIVRMLASHAPFRQLMDRLTRALSGGRTDADTRVRVAMVSAAIGGVVTHPLISDLDDDALAAHLLRLARELLDPSD